MASKVFFSNFRLVSLKKLLGNSRGWNLFRISERRNFCLNLTVVKGRRWLVAVQNTRSLVAALITKDTTVKRNLSKNQITQPITTAFTFRKDYFPEFFPTLSISIFDSLHHCNQIKIRALFGKMWSLFRTQWCRNRGGKGDIWPSQYLADQLTLFQPGRADDPHLSLLSPPPGPPSFSPSGITGTREMSENLGSFGNDMW